MNDVAQLIEHAFELSDAGDVDAAIDAWTDVLSLDPRNAQARFERGMLHLSNDALEAAIDDFLACLAVDSVFPGARDWLARAYQSAGHHDRAAREFETALRADAAASNPAISPQQWADCANAYENAGDPHHARRILSEYFEKYARRANIHRDLETAPLRQYASLLLEADEIPEAIQYASLAYNSRHRKPMDVLVYAQAAERSGELPLARRLCAEAMKLNDQMPGLQELSARLNH
jgi:tetratricopeptide (TPR) repeat protein